MIIEITILRVFMSNKSTKYLSDKDIRKLPIKNMNYVRVVGEPKELYLRVNPSGMKSFFIRYRDSKGKNIKLKLNEFRPGIYSVAEARKEAIAIVSELASGKSIDMIKNTDNYTFKALFDRYISIKTQKGITKDYINRIVSRHETFTLPILGNMDVKDINSTKLSQILGSLFNPNNPSKSRLETIHRIIGDFKAIFAPAIRDGYLGVDPTYGLSDDFPTAYSFTSKKGIDTRYPALTNDTDIAEFIRDLKNDNRMDASTKRAVYLQILTANRPINTASAKWADIDLDERIWTIPATEMKTRVEHRVGLSSYVIEILRQQKEVSGRFEFVFPSFKAKDGHLNRDALSKAIRNLGARDKYSGIASSHGFRATFRTICTLNRAKLLKLELTEDVIEECLAHKEHNKVKLSYEREKATMADKLKLMQWYGDYLNSVENLGI